MPKLYGELISEGKMRVDIVSYSGNRQGGVEVGEVLEGEGVHFVNPLTGEQWFEAENRKTNNSEPQQDTITELKVKLAELQEVVDSLVGD